MKGCWIFLKGFSNEQIRVFVCFLSCFGLVWFCLFAFQFVLWWITFNDSSILNHLHISGMKPTQSRYINFLFYSWTRFARMLLSICVSMFIRENSSVIFFLFGS